MPTKIFDIIPPGEKSSYKNSHDSHEPKEKKENNFSRPVRRPMRGPNRMYLNLGFLGLIFIAMLGGVFYVSATTKSKVDIWPKTENIILNKKITFREGYNAKDPAVWRDAGLMPAKLAKAEKSAEGDYPASGSVKKDEKSSGKIKIYNAYSDAVQPLIAGTRFVSEDGKVFKLKEKVSVPGKSIINGKSVSGEIEAQVEAAEPGPNYNIGQSTFSIPGFVGTPKFTAFYAKSASAMSGGFIGNVAQVLEADILNAQKDLSQKAGKDAIQAIADNTSSGYVFINDEKAVFQNITDRIESAKSGDAKENFHAKVKLESSSLVFEKENVENLANILIRASLPEGKRMDEKSLKIEYQIEKPFNLPIAKAEASDENSKNKTKPASQATGPIDMAVNIKISFNVYSDMKADDIEKSLLGKSINEVKDAFSKKEEIQKVKIDAGPIWRRTFPENMDKVEVALIIDN